MTSPIVRIRNLGYRYPASDFALRIPSLEIATGTRTAIAGPSGSGKTTLLRLLSGISRPDEGTVEVEGNPLHEMSDARRRAFRIARIGFVFQEFELIDHLSVRENILLPYYINAALRLDGETRERADRLAVDLGMGDKLKRNVRRLSQGEAQRVAICRALVARPALLLCDEPTGNLDPANKERIVDLLFDQARATGATLICVTHDHGLLDRFDGTIDFASLSQAVAP